MPPLLLAPSEAESSSLSCLSECGDASCADGTPMFISPKLRILGPVSRVCRSIPITVAVSGPSGLEKVAETLETKEQ